MSTVETPEKVLRAAGIDPEKLHDQVEKLFAGDPSLRDQLSSLRSDVQASLLRDVLNARKQGDSDER